MIFIFCFYYWVGLNSELSKLVIAGVFCVGKFLSENEILREGNISLEILRDKLRTRVSDLEEEMRQLRDELERSLSHREIKSADDEVPKRYQSWIIFCYLHFLSQKHLWYTVLSNWICLNITIIVHPDWFAIQSSSDSQEPVTINIDPLTRHHTPSPT